MENTISHVSLSWPLIVFCDNIFSNFRFFNFSSQKENYKKEPELVQFLDIIRFVENVKKRHKKMIHMVRELFALLWNASCVLSSRHRQRVPFSRSAKVFPLSNR